VIKSVVLSMGAVVTTMWVGTAVLGRCGSGNEDLVKPPSGASQGFVSPDLRSNGIVKSGYVVTLTREASASANAAAPPGKTCNGSAGQPVGSYFATAYPVSNATGTRYFATDTRGTIFFSTTGPIPNPIPTNASVVQ
jgi:hypothetical protein